MLEVLAAVLVLGLLYTVLADVAIEGLRAEGEASRRLEASLLADEMLGALETQVVAGVVPPFGSEEQERDIFRVEVDVVPLALPLEVLAAVAESFPESRLVSEDPEESGIRQIDVRVQWDEGDRELVVARTTFAVDPQQLAPPTDALGGAGAAGGGADADGGSGGGSSGGSRGASSRGASGSGAAGGGGVSQQILDFGRMLGIDPEELNR